MNALGRPVQRRACACAALAVLALVAPRRAAADDVSPAALVAARELFRQGTEDVDAGRYAEALDKFRRVAAVKETPPVRFNIARCEESLGKTGAALADFEAAERDARADPNHASDEVARLAHERAEAIRAKVPRLTLAAASPPAGLAVSLDGSKVADGTLGVPLPVDPGKHVVDATAPGRDPFHAEVALAASEAKRVDIELAATQAAAAPETPGSDTTTPATDATGSSRRTWGWVAVGAGGALLVGAAVFTAGHNSAVSDLEASCPNGRCPSSQRASILDTQSRAQTDESLAIGLGAAGLVAVGAGIALVLTAPNGASVSVTPTTSRSGGGIVVDARF